MHAPRICICIAEDDLRSWVLDELKLVTWITQPTFEIATDLGEGDPATSVVVVGVDRALPAVIEQLRTRTWTTPVIAIGADRGLKAEHVLGPRLTSRELKQALRATLFEARPRIDHSLNVVG